MAGTKPSVSTHFKQSIIGLSLRLAAETKFVRLVRKNRSFLEELFLPFSHNLELQLRVYSFEFELVSGKSSCALKIGKLKTFFGCGSKRRPPTPCWASSHRVRRCGFVISANGLDLRHKRVHFTCVARNEAPRPWKRAWTAFDPCLGVLSTRYITPNKRKVCIGAYVIHQTPPH